MRTLSSLAFVALVACSGRAADTPAPQAPARPDTPCERAAQTLADAASQRDSGFLGRALIAAREADALCATDASHDTITELRAELWLDDATLAAFQRDASDDDKGRARVLYAAGQVLRNRDGDFEAALDRFERSFAIWPKVLTLVQIALTHEAAGRPVDFRKANARALALAEATQDATAQLVPIGGHTAEVYAAAFGPGGKRLVTAGNDGVLNMWDLTSGRILSSWSAPEHIQSLTFRADGSGLLLATETDVMTMSFDDIEIGGPRVALPERARLTVLAPDGERYAAVSSAAIEILALGSSDVERTLMARYVYLAAFSHDGERLATVSASGRVSVWDLPTGDELVTIDAQALDRIVDLALDTHGERVMVAGSGVRVWDVATAAAVDELSSNDRVDSAAMNVAGSAVVPGALAFDPTGVFAAVAAGSVVEVHNADTGEVSRALGAGEGLIGSVSFTGDGLGILTTNTSTRQVEAYFADTDRVMPPVAMDDIAAPLLSSDGATFVAVDMNDGSTIAWSTETGERVGALPGAHAHWAFRPGTSTLGLLQRGTVRLWDIPRQTSVTLGDGATAVTAFAFSRDGAHLVTGDTGGAVAVWDAESGAKVADLDGHTARVAAVAFSPDGATVVSLGDGGTARAQGVDGSPSRPIADVRWTLGDPVAIDVGPNGSLAVCDGQGEGSVVDTSTGALLAVAFQYPNECEIGDTGATLLAHGPSAPTETYELVTGGLLAQDERPVAASANRNVFAAYGKVVDLYDFATGALVLTIRHTADGARLFIAPDGRLDGTLGSTGSGRLVFWQVGDVQLPGFVGLQRARVPGLYAQIIAPR